MADMQLPNRLNFKKADIVVESDGAACAFRKAPRLEHHAYQRPKWEGDNIGDFTTFRYSTDRRNPEILIISNTKFNSNVPLIGYGKDVESLTQLWEKFRCPVTVKRNRSGAQMERDISEYADRLSDDVNFSAVFILSHGKGENVILGSDDARLHVATILSLFTENDNNIKLEGIPKLFFFQCCRANGNAVVAHGRDEREEELLPKMCDTFRAFACPPDLTSFVHDANGSWFIQTVVDVIGTHGGKEQLVDLMTMVNSKMAEKVVSPQENAFYAGAKRISEFTSSLRKRFYFAQ